MLTPLSADLFSVVNAGADIEQLLLLTINDLNDVPNAPRATNLTPRVPDDNTEFVRGIRILESLRERDATELAIGTTAERTERSARVYPDPLGGRDVIEAAKEGYVFRSDAGGRSRLLRRQKDLFLKVRPAYVRSPEMEEVARIFGLTPGLSRYRIKSEL